jgi:hypothetical protein
MKAKAKARGEVASTEEKSDKKEKSEVSTKKVAKK